jgi:hypothetical protein
MLRLAGGEPGAVVRRRMAVSELEQIDAQLIASAREWDARGRDPGELYRGARLAAAVDWAGQHPDELNALEREFLASGRAGAEREARRQRAQNRRLRGLLAGVG